MSRSRPLDLWSLFLPPCRRLTVPPLARSRVTNHKSQNHRKKAVPSPSVDHETGRCTMHPWLPLLPLLGFGVIDAGVGGRFISTLLVSRSLYVLVLLRTPYSVLIKLRVSSRLVCSSPWKGLHVIYQRELGFWPLLVIVRGISMVSLYYE